nr:FAD-dependent oxidoreductase [Cupriavidus taiwanensis]
MQTIRAAPSSQAQSNREIAMHFNESCDLIVVGSGTGGLSTAVTAHLHGLKVIVLEKENVLGGTSALSGGWLWVPGHPLSEGVDGTNTPETAREYLMAETGNRFDAERVDAFLSNGRKAIEFFQKHTSVRFMPSPAFPDYHSEQRGAGKGRSIVTEPIAGSEIGFDIRKLRRPLCEMTFMGLNIGSGSELAHFQKATRSPKSAIYVALRMAQYGYHKLRFGRSMRLTNGNALIARLLKTAFEQKMDIRTECTVTKLVFEDGAVQGLEVRSLEGSTRIKARKGVVLATGGFSHNEQLKRELYRHVQNGAAHHALAAKGATGDGIALARSVGGELYADVAQPAAWMPVSLVRRKDGTTGICSHVIDRTKPGIIAVTSNGRRFGNEANSYHDFLQDFFRANEGAADAHAYLVADHRAVRKYGLGYARPFPIPIGAQIRSGYLKRADTIEQLARICGIDSAGLAGTIVRYNEGAAAAADPEFGKGSTAYNRFQGDPDHKPNPCLEPIAKGPFYAVKILASDIGTFAGIKTDGYARVKAADGGIIPNLYAVGADNASVMSGTYSGAGTNLGPALTFGYIVGRHAAGVND